MVERNLSFLFLNEFFEVRKRNAKPRISDNKRARLSLFFAFLHLYGVFQNFIQKIFYANVSVICKLKIIFKFLSAKTYVNLYRR